MTFFNCISENISIILDLIAGLLIGSDLIISDQRTSRINERLNRWLRLPPLNQIFRNAFGWGVLVAFLLVGFLIAYFVVKEAQTATIINLTWIPIFFAGFIVGSNTQYFSSFLVEKILQRLRAAGNPFTSLMISTSLWGVISIIIFVKTATLPELVPLTLGFLYGVFVLAGSISAITLLRRFITTDPNPNLKRNPRVLARIGLLLFIISKIIELWR